MRPVGRPLLCRVVRVGLVKVFPASRGLSLSGYLHVFRVVYRLPPGDPCCSFGFHLADIPSGQLSELSSQLPKLTAHSSVSLSLPSKFREHFLASFGERNQMVLRVDLMIIEEQTQPTC